MIKAKTVCQRKVRSQIPGILSIETIAGDAVAVTYCCCIVDLRRQTEQSSASELPVVPT